MQARSYTAIKVVLAILTVVFLTNVARAQDATKVAPAHYKVEFENDQVRVLRVNYGPGEESEMHEHPDLVAVFLTDHLAQFTYPDGKTEEIPAKAGQAIWVPAGKHAGKNVGDKPFELILVELKSTDQMEEKE